MRFITSLAAALAISSPSIAGDQFITTNGVFATQNADCNIDLHSSKMIDKLIYRTAERVNVGRYTVNGNTYTIEGTDILDPQVRDQFVFRHADGSVVRLFFDAEFVEDLLTCGLPDPGDEWPCPIDFDSEGSRLANLHRHEFQDNAEFREVFQDQGDDFTDYALQLPSPGYTETCTHIPDYVAGLGLPGSVFLSDTIKLGIESGKAFWSRETIIGNGDIPIIHTINDERYEVELNNAEALSCQADIQAYCDRFN